MKKNTFISRVASRLALVAFALCCGFSLAACDDDDDDSKGGSGEGGEEVVSEDLAAPASTANAAQFIISDATSPYSAIYLSESGEYFIVAADADYAPAVNNPKKAAADEGDDEEDGDDEEYDDYADDSDDGFTDFKEVVKTGTYTKSGNVYTLNGFGTITAKDDEITINTNDGSSITVAAESHEASAEATKDVTLCRKWELTKVTFECFSYGTQKVSLSASTEAEAMRLAAEWAKTNDPDYDPDEYNADDNGDTMPKAYTFSKFGLSQVVFATLADGSITQTSWERLNTTVDLGFKLNGSPVYYELSGGKLLFKLDSLEHSEEANPANQKVVTYEYSPA